MMNYHLLTSDNAAEVGLRL